MLKEINHENISLLSDCIKIHSCRTEVCHIEYIKTKNGHSCRSRNIYWVSFFFKILILRVTSTKWTNSSFRMRWRNKTPFPCEQLLQKSNKWKILFGLLCPGDLCSITQERRLTAHWEYRIICRSSLKNQYLFRFEISGQKFILLVQLQSLLQYNES